MGVQVGGTKGARRALNAELNLVPFIDLLSVCITFLLATAVWVELESMPVDQAIGDSEATAEPKPPPLSVHVRADGVWVGGETPVGRNIELVGGSYDWAQLEAELLADRELHSEAHEVVLVTDDGVAYGDMIHALDLTRKHGYHQTLLGGGPEASTE